MATQDRRFAPRPICAIADAFAQGLAGLGPPRVPFGSVGPASQPVGVHCGCIDMQTRRACAVGGSHRWRNRLYHDLMGACASSRSSDRAVRLARGGSFILATLLVSLGCEHDIVDPCPEMVHRGDFHLRAALSEDDHRITDIAGDLILDDPAATDLELPECLERVGRNLIVTDQAALAAVTGRGRLHTVFGNVSVMNDPALVTMTGLRGLSSIGGDLFIVANEQLTDVDAFAELEHLGRHLIVTDNPMLESLHGFAKLWTVPGNVSVRNNPGLHDLAGFDGLARVGGALEIAKNPGLVDLRGLARLHEIGAKITLTDNEALETLDGLDSLVSIGIDEHVPRHGAADTTLRHPDDGIAVHCHFNPKLRNFDPVNPLIAGHLISVIGNLAVTSNDALSTCHVEHLGRALGGFSWQGTTRSFNNVDCEAPQRCVGTVCQ